MEYSYCPLFQYISLFQPNPYTISTNEHIPSKKSISTLTISIKNERRYILLDLRVTDARGVRRVVVSARGSVGVRLLLGQSHLVVVEEVVVIRAYA